MRNQTAAFSIPLPPGYRCGDFLALHGRDEQQVSERTTPRGMEKGIPWRSAAACLRMTFHKDRVTVRLHADGSLGEDREATARETALHMLGLNQPVASFEASYADHPLLGKLVAANAGLRVPQAASPFEALCWAIIGQLVSVRAAVSMRRRVILAAGLRHSGGLFCFPDAARLATLDIPALRGCGLSQTKALSLKNLAEGVLSGGIPLDAWLDAARKGALDAEEVRSTLSAIRGIGPWTISYALLRGFGHLDGSLHGDVAVRRNLARLLEKDAVTEKETAAWLAPFSPWRALVAAHLWGMQSRDGY